jgi:serine-type D-Ala-D-Ala carboxypeptidase (penicillin-binding protein 5/6)
MNLTRPSAILLSVLLVSGSAFANPVYANPVYESKAPIAYMIDLSSGAILFDKQSNQKIPPASMAKMMTAYVIFDMLHTGKLSLNQKFTVKPEIWKQWNNQGSTMFLSPNEQVSVENLLHGLVTLSGNDASIVLADSISGSEAAFVTEMNKTAKRLGMASSHFGTPNGWPDEGRTLTTAHDLALLARRTIDDFPQYYSKFYGKTDFQWGGVTQPDRNPLLGKIVGADGLKTGHTDEAGYCFTGTAIQNGRRVLMVVAGLASYNDRITESTKFMEWGFSAWRSQALFPKGKVVAVAPVQLGNYSSLELVAPKNMAVTFPAEKAGKYRLFVRYNGPIKAPFKKGDNVANLVIKFADGSEQVSPLVSSVDVEEAGFFGRVWNGVKSLLNA